ncbi:hypothetical protein KCU87_g526, partial [Aureobasidium melanogenum]
MHHFIFETSLTVHARTGLLLRFASRRKEEPPGAIKMGNNMLKLTLGTQPNTILWLQGRSGSAGVAAIVAAIRRIMSSESLSILISNNTQTSFLSSSARNSNKSANRGICCLGSWVVSNGAIKDQSQSIIFSGRPKQRFKVLSWDNTTTPSLVMCTSVSSAWAPMEIAPAKAARVFSGYLAL